MTGSGGMGIGIVGAGFISDEYLTTLSMAPDVEVRALADLETGRAEAQARKHGVPAWGSLDELFSDPTVELVVNLTVPQVHAAVSARALRAGRHVWSEKPLATSLEDARALSELAAGLGLRLGCAPDTFLGTGTQSALAELAAGCIGTPLTGFASCQYSGPDSWHPSPAFLFARGGGPVLDIGPYVLTTLVLVFGSLGRVTARGVTTRDARTIAVGPKAGTVFPVEVPTHVNALLEFVSGGLVDAIFSFDSPIERTVLEVAGAHGAMTLPGVGSFGQEATLHTPDARAVPLRSRGAGGTGRGTGVVDMVRSLREGRPHRADSALATHVLEGLLAIEESARTRKVVELSTVAPATELLPEGWAL